MRHIFSLVLIVLFVGFTNGQNFTPNIWTVDTGPTDKVNVSGMTFFHSLKEDNSIWSTDSTKLSNTQSNQVLESRTNNIDGLSSIYNFGSPDTLPTMLPTKDGKAQATFDSMRDSDLAGDNRWSNTFTSAIQTNTRTDTQTDTPVDLSTLGIRDFKEDSPTIEQPGVSDIANSRLPTLSLSGKFVDQSNRPIFRVKTKFIDESNNRKPGFKAKSAFVDSSNFRPVSPTRSQSTRQNGEFVPVLTSGTQQDNKISYLTPGSDVSDTNINFRNLAANTPRNVGQYTTTIETTTDAPVNNNNFITTPQSNTPQSTDLQIESLYPKAPFPINDNINTPSGFQEGDFVNQNKPGIGSSNQDVQDTIQQKDFLPSPIPAIEQVPRPSSSVPRVTQPRTIDHFETEPNVQVINQFGDNGMDISEVSRKAIGGDLPNTNDLQGINSNFFDQTRNAFRNGNVGVRGGNPELSRSSFGRGNIINGNNRGSLIRPIEQGSQLGTIQNQNNPRIPNGFTNSGVQKINNQQTGLPGNGDMNIGRLSSNDFINDKNLNTRGSILADGNSGNRVNILPFQNGPNGLMNDTPGKTQSVINPTSDQFGKIHQNILNNAVPVVTNQESTLLNTRDQNQNSIFEINPTQTQQDSMRGSSLPVDDTGFRNMVTNQADTSRTNNNAVNPSNTIIRPRTNNNIVNLDTNITPIRSSARNNMDNLGTKSTLLRPDTINNMVNPPTNNNLVRPSTINNIVRANTDSNMMREDSNNNMLRTGTSNNMMRPNINKNMVGPSINNNMVGPSTHNNMVGPSINNNMVGQSTNNNKMIPSINNNMIRPSTNNNMMGPSINNNMVRPSTNDNRVNPNTNDNMARTSTRNSIIRPNANNNIVNPNANNNIVNPSANNNINKQSTNNNIVKPGTKDNIERPSVNNNMVRPRTINNMVMAGTNNNMIRPGENSNMVNPTTNNNFVRPDTDNNINRPVTNNNVINAPINNNFIRPNTDKNVVRPGINNNMINAPTNNNFGRPNTGNNVIRSGTNNNVVRPSTTNNLVRNSVNNNVLRPSTINNVINPSTTNNMVNPDTNNNIGNPNSNNMVIVGSSRAPSQISGFNSPVSGVNPDQSIGQNRFTSTQNQFNPIQASINNGQNFQSMSPNVPISNFNNNPNPNFRNFQNSFQQSGFIQERQNGQNGFRSVQNNNFQTPSNFGTFQNIRSNGFSNTLPNRNFQPGPSNFQTPRFSSINDFNPQQPVFGLQNRRQFNPGNSFQTNRQLRPFG